MGKNLHYTVEYKRAGEGEFTPIAAFDTHIAAEAYARKCKKEGGVLNIYRTICSAWKREEV